MSLSDDFYGIFVAIMINNVLTFVMNMFAIYMLEKMSRAKWSMENDDTQVAKKTTQMDREVAAGFFDYKMMIPDFVFSNFTHNIPRHSSSLDSNRSSNIDSSPNESIISLHENDDDAENPPLIHGDGL